MHDCDWVSFICLLIYHTNHALQKSPQTESCTDSGAENEGSCHSDQMSNDFSTDDGVDEGICLDSTSTNERVLKPKVPPLLPPALACCTKHLVQTHWDLTTCNMSGLAIIHGFISQTWLAMFWMPSPILNGFSPSCIHLHVSAALLLLELVCIIWILEFICLVL